MMLDFSVTKTVGKATGRKRTHGAQFFSVIFNSSSFAHRSHAYAGLVSAVGPSVQRQVGGALMLTEP